jgi:hypothetical protein
MKTTTPLRIILGAFIMASLALILPAAAYSGNNIEDHIIETETGIYYIVQPGDTLWDLSHQFSDSPWLWPDMWNENQQITNPHLIYPGDRIKLYRRTDVNRVQTAVSEPKPVGKTYTYHDIDAVGFIRKKALDPSGIIIGVDRSKNIVSDYDVVYITPQTGQTFAVGEKYTVYRTLAEIADNDTKAYIGIQHYLLGVVEITQVAPDVAVGTIKKAFRGIAVNDNVTPYLKRPAIIEIKESVPGLSGKLISTEDHENLISEYRTAFIDKGEIDGIEIGQYYTIFNKIKDRVIIGSKEETINIPPKKMGTLLVLHTEENNATALIIQSQPFVEDWMPIGTPR